MTDCPFQYDPTRKLWICPDCNRETPPRASCQRQLCRLPPKWDCPASQTPEAIAAQAAQQAEAEAQAKHGPGTHLHRAVKALTGEGITAGCGCSSLIAQMNRNPPEWSRQNIEKIIDRMLKEVDRRLNGAQDAQKPARWRLRLGGLDLPGRRWALRRLVLGAVRRAEAACGSPTNHK